MQFSANLGFLWADLPLTDAIRAAASAGFVAVECHWPYATPAADVRAALDETGLPMLGLNTTRGDTTAGENGLSALPGRQDDAQRAIDEAITYARATGTRAIHVMAGFASGPEALACFVENLSYASAQAPELTLLVEPLNRHDAPGYFLQTTDQAQSILQTVDRPNVKLMFDCYHVGRTEGDVVTRIETLLPLIGHIQFASVPARSTPDLGEINYRHVFQEISRLGWAKPLGAEYKPDGPTAKTLGWMETLTR